MSKFNLNSIDSYSYEPLRKQVYNVLREAILKGELMIGEKITEMEIADELNVSRTPVREAFRMLEQEELINIIPQQGVFIAGIETKKEIDDIFQLRTELEGLAAFLAAKKINEEQKTLLKEYTKELENCIANDDQRGCIRVDIAFHRIIKEASNNRWLEKFLDTLFEQATRFRHSSFSRQGRMQEFLSEHMELAEAINSGDADKARKCAEDHIKAAWNSILTVFKKENN
ncbi:MAG: GntR family transcriptional regulator [Halanaerobium sp. 4-GBenrich]|jgi:DNA-binding GntR family transcriptional regulator|uniref:DNA-binding GntR family transcriptional regulator n=1 Tax=Halanaerobium congolense TaxID=54121 RepID=A0A1G6LEH0_9FIRM|nr:GntR family transcriptional regulator [Halanaerobium congolense]KXS48797.1 MAG: GntR family transcriptional regulator [Halanaerobium sp. T82-1]ODS49754.1 MAG: GntR family transcriptional regulator [Halanaerobium sp. 4-GBenrich]OEG63373.1 MAG: GntR family transcriptional regulator [Halanaerobium sp. MDAL1]PUU89925.1 MAG: GntR family transcriptional regulator [Halanaerobium sp.]PTX15735.1 DNA-binding GntR family transcriptional regulator [Halanaerobium congolense]